MGAMAALVIATMSARLLSDGRRLLARAEAALAQNDTTLAIAYAERSAASYVPGASHVSRAYHMLFRRAQECEARRDYACALQAWRAVRSAAIGSRCAWLPSPPERGTAEAAIARLLGAGADAAEAERSAAASELGASQRTWLATNPPPHRGSLLLRCAVLAALTALWGWRLLPRADRSRVKITRQTAVWLAALACAWVVSFLFDRQA